jgi:hypothetical protein
MEIRRKKMKNVKHIKVFFLCVLTGICLYSNGISAWERTAKENCKKDEKSCEKKAKDKNGDTSKCEKQMDQCKKEAPKTDEDSFASSLSHHSRSQFRNFTPEQKRKAMDYADKNRMSPEDAVAKVMKTNY